MIIVFVENRKAKLKGFSNLDGKRGRVLARKFL
jgi:hypothetical protein